MEGFIPGVLQVVVVSLAVVGLLFWITTLVIGIWGARHVGALRKVTASAPPSWPRLSVIIPACNEVDTLPVTARVHGGTSYPDVEFVLIDDRSTDGTSALVDRLAEADSRIRPVHIAELPEGWLGKVHALQTGQQVASGEWLLFADADVVMDADTLEKAIAFCENENVDFLTLIPRFLPVGLAVDAAVTSMARSVFGGGQVWRVSDPRARQAAGFGAFILVRRAAWERTEGFEGLRMEIADDLGIGLLMKESGARCAVLRGPEVRLHFYQSLAEMRGSIEKGGFGIIGRYSLARLLALTLAMLLMELGPFAAFLPVGITASWLPALGAAGVATAITASVAGAVWLGRPVLSGVLFPVGILLNTCFAVRSGIIGWWNGGIRWRGTFYPTSQLRSGQRVRWP